MRILQNKRGIVTGAASGIGKALAIELAARGMELLLLDRDFAELEQTAAFIRSSGGSVQIERLDLAERSEVQRLAEVLAPRWGACDLLVNNAGIVHNGPTAEMTSTQLERLLQVNLFAPTEITRAFLPHLLERPEAHIVNVASIYGIIATPNCSAYHASKFGLLGFSESLYWELRGTTVGVTSVCPGFVSTNLFRSGTSNREEGIPNPPARFCTTPESVAHKIVRGIERRQRLVIVTPLAWVLYYIHRFAPWLLPIYHRLLARKMRRKTQTEFQSS